jgi:predicted transcriptional regulator
VNTLAVLSVLVTGKASTGVHDAQFGELEAVIMNGLWARDRSALVREAADDLQKDRQIAHTTVMM